MLRRSDELKNFEIGDGSTMQVTSTLRVGGKQKDKKSKDGKKQAAGTKKPQQKFKEETKNDKGPMLQFDKEAMISEAWLKKGEEEKSQERTG